MSSTTSGYVITIACPKFSYHYCTDADRLFLYHRPSPLDSLKHIELIGGYAGQSAEIGRHGSQAECAFTWIARVAHVFNGIAMNMLNDRYCVVLTHEIISCMLKYPHVLPEEAFITMAKGINPHIFGDLCIILDDHSQSERCHRIAELVGGCVVDCGRNFVNTSVNYAIDELIVNRMDDIVDTCSPKDVSLPVPRTFCADPDMNDDLNYDYDQRINDAREVRQAYAGR